MTDTQTAVLDVFDTFGTPQRYEYSNDRSSKYWTYLLARPGNGSGLLLRQWGRIGVARTHAKWTIDIFPDWDEAVETAFKVRSQKVNNGYTPSPWFTQGEGFYQLLPAVNEELREFRAGHPQMPMWATVIGSNWTPGDEPGTGYVNENIAVYPLWEMLVRMHYARWEQRRGNV